jgi:Pyridoxamine 5'-phosphate oxidase
VDPAGERLRMYGSVTSLDALSWDWVQGQLESAGTYWVVPVGDGHPHPRPVWGVWLDNALQLSVGSPVVARQLAADPTVTVHLDSGTDVVVVEGNASLLPDDTADRALEAYNAKYDWDYSVAEYGPLTTVSPTTVMAWRSAGWAGRDGFQQAGRWHIDRCGGD